MADNVELDPGTGGATIATDDVAGIHYQYVKLASGTDQSTTVVPAGGGTEASALRVTVASDSTGVLSVDDNGSTLSVDDGGGSITVDNGGTFAVQADTELTTADLDTGAGTDTRAVVGLVIAKSGGAANISNSDPLPISDAGGNLSIDDGGNSITVDNGGTFAVQESGSALTALQLIDDTIIADDAAFTVGTTKVNVVGFFADQTSTDSVNEGDVGAARMTLDRKQIVTNSPSADTEGLDTFRSADIDETEEDVKTSPGKLYGWAVYNDHSSEVFIQFWNATAANTTPGTTTPRVTFPLAAGASANFWVGDGITFDTAITVGATSTFAGGSDPTGPVSGTIFYK